MNKMIKWTFTLMMTLGVLMAHAQQEGGPDDKNHNHDRREAKERIKAMYKTYMTEALSLDENDEKKFWPVQQQYSEEIKAVNKQAQISEIDREEATLNIRKKYNEKFSKLIGKDRTDIFFKKDKEFRNKMVDGLKKKRMEKRGEGGKRNRE